MTYEPKRDLMADLEICERATSGPWEFLMLGGDGDINPAAVVKTKDHHYISYKMFPNEQEILDCQFIAEAREGWPHAIRRALEAEKRVAELEAEVERLREQNKHYREALQHM